MSAAVGNPVLLRGIGDDCAILRPTAGQELLITTDLCVEGVHFRREWHPPRSAGHRCLARGLSDIAAMGGEPVACFLSLGLPGSLPQPWTDGFMRGLLALAGQFKVPLAGGDTSSSDKIIADIMVLGQAPSGSAVLRSEARPGDRIFVTGELGGSAAALKGLYAGNKLAASVRHRHFYPMPRLDLGRWLRQKKIPSAMIDLSDGLSIDLAHVCRESNVTAVIDAAAIPVARGASLELAMHGGEDYELLFTAPQRTKLPAKIMGISITCIGEIQGASSRRGGVQVRDEAGRVRPLKLAGWEHFRKI